MQLVGEGSHDDLGAKLCKAIIYVHNLLQAENLVRDRSIAILLSFVHWLKNDLVLRSFIH